MASPTPAGLSPLAARILADHRRAPEAAFYDLASLGSFFDSAAVERLDQAYTELVREGLVERTLGMVTFGGNRRSMFRLVDASGALTERRTA